MQYIPMVLAVLGAVLLVYEIVNEERDRRAGRSASEEEIRWGTNLAIASLFAFYPLGWKYVVFGMPFLTFVLERSERGWVDFVADWSLIAAVLNFVVAYLLPRVWMRSRWRRRISAGFRG